MMMMTMKMTMTMTILPTILSKNTGGRHAIKIQLLSLMSRKKNHTATILRAKMPTSSPTFPSPKLANNAISLGFNHESNAYCVIP